MKFALLIGINYTGIDKSELYGCVDDVFNMRDMLVHEMKYLEENITILYDTAPNKELSPTKKNILRTLTEFVDNKQPEDELWLHYSGHGSIRTDRSYDEKYGIDSVIIPIDFQTNGVILDDEIFTIIKDVKGVLFLLFDCCHSGSICDLPISYSYIDNIIVKETVNKNYIENSRIYAISGSTDKQVSMEHHNKFIQKRVGALTYAFLMLLNISKYKISIEELFIEVCKYLSHTGLKQTPILSTTSNELKYTFVSK
jgi:hypothetical protein